MQILEVKVKKLRSDAVIPQYATFGDACFDLVAVEKEVLIKAVIGKDRQIVKVPHAVSYSTGLAFEIPKDHVGLIYPRSSIYKSPYVLANSVGVIDSGYRGEIKVIMKFVDVVGDDYKVGDRIAQMMIVPIPKVKLTEVKELSDSKRGEGGFGSTGK